MNSHQGNSFLKRIVKATSAKSFQLALLILLTLAMAEKGFGQTYQFSIPISGGMSLGVNNSGGNSGPGNANIAVNFGTLTETIVYDPVNLTLRQVGYITVINPDLTNTWTVSWQTGYTNFIYGSVTVQQHLVGSFIAFDSGTIAYRGDTNSQYFSVLRDDPDAPIQISGSYSLVTGGQTYTGDFSPTLSFGGFLYFNDFTYAPYYNISTNNDLTSITLSGGNLGYSYTWDKYSANTGVITASDGLSINLYSGIDSESDQNFSITSPASVIATLVAPPIITSIVPSGSGTFVFNGTNGFAGGAYHLLSSTNLTLPPASWTQESAGFFDGNGNFSITNSIPANVPQKFYRLTIP